MNLTRLIQVACDPGFRRIVLPDEGVVLFASALAGEGKTFAAVELATAKALKSSKDRLVLFLDLHPGQAGTSIFIDKPGTPGVYEILVNNRAVTDCTQSTGIPNLFVLPYGNSPPGFEPLPYLNPFFGLIETLKKDYLVFIDTVPAFISGRGKFDPAEVAAVADITYLVVLTGKTPREVVLRSKLDIEKCGGKIAGVIMNDRFVRPFRTEVAGYLTWLEKIPLVKYPVRYFRARMGIY